MKILTTHSLPLLVSVATLTTSAYSLPMYSSGGSGQHVERSGYSWHHGSTPSLRFPIDGAYPPGAVPALSPSERASIERQIQLEYRFKNGHSNSEGKGTGVYLPQMQGTGSVNIGNQVSQFGHSSGMPILRNQTPEEINERRRADTYRDSISNFNRETQHRQPSSSAAFPPGTHDYNKAFPSLPSSKTHAHKSHSPADLDKDWIPANIDLSFLDK